MCAAIRAWHVPKVQPCPHMYFLSIIEDRLVARGKKGARNRFDIIKELNVFLAC